MRPNVGEVTLLSDSLNCGRVERVERLDAELYFFVERNGQFGRDPLIFGDLCGGDGEFEVGGLLGKVLVGGVHAELRVGHLEEGERLGEGGGGEEEEEDVAYALVRAASPLVGTLG